MKTTEELGRYVIVFMIAVLVVVGLYEFFLKVDCVGDEETERYCLDDKIVAQKFCINNKWHIEELQTCPAGDICFSGVCVDGRCSGVEQLETSCLGDYAMITQRCIDRRWDYAIKICKDNEFCDPGTGRCAPRPPKCGDGYCTGLETTDNCPRDCSLLGSWSRLYKYIADHPETGDYLVCDEREEYDCDSREIRWAVAEIENTYHPATPKEYIDATTDWVHEFITYDYGGNYGISASEMIKRYEERGEVKHNCVGYSVLMLSILRARNIPVVQQTGCISHKGIMCSMYTVVRQDWHVGHITGEDNRIADQYGNQALGHSYLKVFDGEEWILVDPTADISVSNCLGYYDIGKGCIPSEPNLQYFILDYESIQACKEF